MRSSWLAVVAAAAGCGRIGFEARAHDAAADDAPADTAPDGPPATIAFVKTFVQQAVTTPGLTDTFSATATNAGDAIPVHVFCEASVQPTNVTLAGPAAWTIVQLNPIDGAAGGDFWVAQYGLVAPDTQLATFTVTWATSSMCGFVGEMGDEFTNTDAQPFDASVTSGAMTGDCAATVTTVHAYDAVWAACTTNCVSAAGTGYTKTADDGHCDAAEWKPTTDPAGTAEQAGFPTTTQTIYAMSAVALRPR